MKQQVYFYNTDREKLAGTLHLPETPSEKGVVMGHCFTCSRHTRILTRICNALAQKGFMALRFDFSGNGQSQGSFAESSYTKHIAEMKSAANFMSEKGASRIGFGGHSMGAAISVLAAAEIKNVKAVCVLAGRLSELIPARYLNDLQKKELRETGQASFDSRGRSLKLSENFFSDAHQHDIPGIVTSLQIPLLVIHGDQDDIIPVEETRSAYNLNPSNIKLAIIPGADHMFSDEGHREEIAAMAAEWFAESLDNPN